MPKYSVEEVVDIIRSLTSDEKTSLIAQLPTILEMVPMANPTAQIPGAVQTRSMSVGGDFAVSGTGVNVDFSQTQVGSGVSTAQSAIAPETSGLEAIAQQLAQFKQTILQSEALNPVQRATVEVPLQIVQAELQKPAPNKTLVEQAIATLKQGLEGIQTLAEPLLNVTELVAKAWLLL